MARMLTPVAGLVAGAALAVATATSLRRAHRFDRTSRTLLLMGIAMFALAAGSPVWFRAGADRVTVMVDLSPSTRGADYRNRARLNAKISQLLGNTPVDLLAFAGSNAAMPSGENLTDLPADQTVFNPPPGQPVLLFSDGQFELPAESPPVYAVLDPQLMEPDDSRVTALQVNRHVATATVEHHGPPRQAAWSGAKSNAPITVASSTVTSAEVRESEVSLSLNAGDLWPENDALAAKSIPPEIGSRWWIGSRDPGAGWTRRLPSQTPIDPAAWLEPSVVVLDNVAADALDRLQQDALLRYVRDLGGSVIILGGDHAFAACGFGNTPLGTVSPLADSPPTPSTQWIILIDASGSMAAPGPAGSLFDTECAAARALLPLLPPADSVQVAAFNRITQGWINSTAAAAISQPLPPPGAAPNGPTALEPALHAALQPSRTPTQVLLMTDADTDPVAVSSIVSAASAAHAKLLVLALGDGRALPSLREAAVRTQGRVVEQADAAQWVRAATELLKSQLPDRVERSATQFTFNGDLQSLGTRQVEPWNHTWLKQGAQTLASTTAAPMVARWQVGSGNALAAAYAMPTADVNVIADAAAVRPADPRFTVRYDTSGAAPQVKVTAIDHERFLNGQPLRLISVDPQSTTPLEELPIPQVAPGRYETAIPPSSRTRLVRIMLGPQQIDRRAIAGRYPAEFDRIGINQANLQQLADRTGGAVVPASQMAPLRLHATRVQWSLTEPLIGAGVLLISGGLWRWKRGR